MNLLSTPILLFGASGFIGRALHDAIGSDMSLATHLNNPGKDTVHFDVNESKLESILPKNHSFKHAILLAGQTNIDSCAKNSEASLNANVKGLKRLCHLLKEESIKPIFASSDHVFDGIKGGYTESDPCTPIVEYGRQKKEMEEFIKDNFDDYLIFRIAKVYGSNLEDKTLFSSWIDDLLNNKEIRCAKDQVFSPIHIHDVVQTILESIRLNLSGTYHLGGPDATSRTNMLGTLIEIMKESNIKAAEPIECSLHDLPFIEKRPLNTSMDSSLIQDATNFKFRFIEQSCEELVQAIK